MPRKSIAAELQAEEAATSSPIRRSSRVVNSNSTTPAAVVTRRTSETLEPSANNPARATRSRRASAQGSEEKVEVMPGIRTRRASMLAEEEIQKESFTPTTRRNRRPSEDLTEKEEPEKPKSVRGRRTSSASLTEESDEKKPLKLVPARERKNVTNFEPEAESKGTTKTPAKAASRRRSSATENAIAEEVSTPAKRTTRGRRASDADDVFDKEKSNKPPTRGRKKSVNQEEEDQHEESVKPAGRRGRRTSTDASPTNTAPKTPGRLGRRSSISKEADSEDSSKEKKDNSEVEKLNNINKDDNNEEVISPIVLNDVSIKVTPLKKRKILEKMDELELSIINESFDDISNSKHDESSGKTEQNESEKEKYEQVPSNVIDQSMEDSVEDLLPMVLKEISVKVTPLKKRKILEKIEELGLNNKNVNSDSSEFSNKTKNSESEKIESKQIKTDQNLVKTSLEANSLHIGESPVNKSYNLAEEIKINPSEINIESQNTPSNNKRSPSQMDTNPSPRKSPRLTEKLARNNTPKEVQDHNKAPTPRKSRNLMKENANEVSINEITQASFVSSGSDGSFKFHLSNVSIANSGQLDSNKETTQEEILNTSTGSNKENIELDHTLDISAKIPIQEPIVAYRVSNVFKPNQKDYSFVEPMEIDEDSIMLTEMDEKNIKLDSSLNPVNDQKITEKDISVPSPEISPDNLKEQCSDGDEYSVIFNYKAVVKKSKAESDVSMPTSPNQQQGTSPILDSGKIALKQSLTETDGSDTNLIIEETQDTVNFSIEPKTKKIDPPTLTSIENISSSPAGINASLIINQPLEQVKVVLVGKSSSPVSKTRDSTDSKNDIIRRSKSKSKSPSRRSATRSPRFISESAENSNARKSKSRSKSPRKSKSPVTRDSNIFKTESDRSKSKSPNRRISKSPSCFSLDTGVKCKRPVVQDDTNLSPKGLNNSKPKNLLKDSAEKSVMQENEKLLIRRSIVAMSESPHKETHIINENEKLTNHSPQLSTSLENRLTKPTGVIEIIATNNKMSEESSEVMEKSDKDTSSKYLQVYDITHICKTTENHLEVSDINNSETEHLNIQDKTEYHTAVATVNTIDSDFTSPLTTGNKATESQIKHSESTHYDFDLDSDEDMSYVISKNTGSKQESHMVIGNDEESENLSEIEVSSTEKENDSYAQKNSKKSNLKESNEKLVVSTSVETEDGSKHNTVTACYLISESKDTNKLSQPNIKDKNIIEETKDSSQKCSMNESPVIDDEYKELPEGVANEEMEQIQESVSPNDSLNDEFVTKNKKYSNQSPGDAIGNANKLNSEQDKKKNSQINISVEKVTLSRKDVQKADKSKEDVKSTKSRPSLEKCEYLKLKDYIRLKAKKLKESSSEEEKEYNESIDEDQDSVILDDMGNSNNSKNSEQDDDEFTINVEKADKFNDDSSMNTKPKEDVKLSKPKPSLEKFAYLKLEQYLSSKAEELQESSSEEEEKSETGCEKEEKSDSSSKEEERSEAEYHEFIDGMAEEGEEDAPSEDSNQIIDEGESIGYSSNEEISEDDYDSNDSFICNEEELELLSGEEDFLGEENKKKSKKSRIIDANTLGDGDIIKIPKKRAVQKNEQKKRSRIISVSDSSDDETEMADLVSEMRENVKGETKNVKKDQSVNESVVVIDDSTIYDKTSNAEIGEESKAGEPIVTEDSKTGEPILIEEFKTNEPIVVKESKTSQSIIIEEPKTSEPIVVKESKTSQSIIIEESKTGEPILIEEFKTNKPIVVKESKTSQSIIIEEPKTSEPIVIEGSENNRTSEILIEDSKILDTCEEAPIDESFTKDSNDVCFTEEEDSKSVHNNCNTSLSTGKRKSSLSIQENILVDGIKDPLITQRINTLVESFCSTVKQGEISLNLSLEYEGTPQEKEKPQLVRILSDIKICPSHFKERQQEDTVDLQENTEQEEAVPSTSFNDTGDLRGVLNRKNLKRRLSKNVDDIQEEVNSAKRRRIHESDKKKEKNENIPKAITSKKTKKHNKREKKSVEQLESAITSFGIMNQLITDVKNRPKRMIKPTRTDAEVENVWTTTKVTNLKPSTSPASRQEKIKIESKLHPKDFRNQMLLNEKRVKRIDTKSLLKKKGAFN